MIILLVFCMTMPNVTVFSDDEFTEYLENFSGVGNGSFSAEGWKVVSEVNVSDGTDGKKVYLASDTSRIIWYPTQTIGKSFYVETEFSQESISDVYSILSASQDPHNAENMAFIIGADNGNIVLRHKVEGASQASTTNIHSGYEAGHTYRLRVFCDMSNKSLDIWLDGQELLDSYDIGFMGADVETIGRFNIQTARENGRLTVKTFAVLSEMAVESVSALADTYQTYSDNIECGGYKGNCSVEDKNTFTAAISAARNAYENFISGKIGAYEFKEAENNLRSAYETFNASILTEDSELTILENQISTAKEMIAEAKIGPEQGRKTLAAVKALESEINKAQETYSAILAGESSSLAETAVQELKTACETFAANTNEEFFEDFEGYESAEDLSKCGWVIISGSVEPEKEGQENGLKFTSTEESTCARIVKYTDFSAEIINVSFEFMLPEKGAAVQIFQAGSNPYSTSDHVIFEVSSNDSDVVLTCKDIKKPIISNYENGKWYKVEAELCISDGVMGIYIDGKRVLSGLKLMPGFSCSSFDRISAYTEGASFHLDNIKIVPQPYKSTILSGIPQKLEPFAFSDRNLIYPHLTAYSERGMEIDVKNVSYELPDGFDENTDGSISISPSATAGGYSISANGVASADIELLKTDEICVEGYFEDADGNEYTRILTAPTGEYNAIIRTYNNTEETRSINVYVARYCSGVLKKAEVITLDLPPQELVCESFAITAECDDTIKLFCWEQSLCPAAERNLENPALTVLETAGVCGKRFVRRGIPLEKGYVYSADDIILLDDDGNTITSTNEVLEKHDDGSVKWLSAAFIAELLPYEKQSYYIEKGSCQQGSCIAEYQDGKAVLDNGIIRVEADSDYVSLLKDGKTVIEDIWVFAATSESELSPYTLEYDIVKNTPVYAVIKISADIDSVKSELYLTMYANSDIISIEARLTPQQDITLCAEGIKLKVAGETAELQRSYAKFCNSVDDMSVSLASSLSGQYDDLDGGLFEKDGFLYYSPIQGGEPYLWLDGLSKTVSLLVKPEDANNADALELLKIAENPIFAAVDSEYFKKAGYISSNVKNDISDSMAQQIKNSFYSTYGGFESAYLPSAISNNTDNVRERLRHGGESEYNMWFWAMASSDGELFNIIDKSTQTWADMRIYKGKYESMHGANRYKLDECYGDTESRMSQPYYGDASGIYLSWLMTGNPYYKEIFDMCCEHVYESIEKNGYPLINYWTTENADEGDRGIGYRVRCSIWARPLYFKAVQSGEEKYKDAAAKIGDWLRENQEEEGFWYQTYDKNGIPLAQNEGNEISKLQPAVKNYIMLYGLRGFMEYLRMSGDSSMDSSMESCADWIIGEIGEKGEIWSPVSDMSYYYVEPYECAHTACLSITVMREMFEKTGEDRYLEAMCKLLRFYISTHNTHRMSINVGNDKANFLKEMTVLPQLLANNSSKVISMGYYDVVCVFGDGTQMLQKDIDYDSGKKEFTINCYDTPKGEVMVMGACALEAYYKKQESFRDYSIPTNENRIWSGSENLVSDSNVTLSGSLNAVDINACVRLPVGVNGTDVRIYDVQYIDEKTISLKADAVDTYELIVYLPNCSYSIGSMEKNDAEGDGCCVIPINNANGETIKLYLN